MWHLTPRRRSAERLVLSSAMKAARTTAKGKPASRAPIRPYLRGAASAFDPAPKRRTQRSAEAALLADRRKISSDYRRAAAKIAREERDRSGITALSA